MHQNGATPFKFDNRVAILVLKMGLLQFFDSHLRSEDGP